MTNSDNFKPAAGGVPKASSSSADPRVADNDENIDAAMSPTGLDIDNDHADERPVDRSQDGGTPQKPDEFNETAPVQPGTEINPGAPAETPVAPNTEPPVPDAPTDGTLRPDNLEQDDESAQAQTLAGEAMSGNFETGESEHGGKANPAQVIPDDEQDIVDHMQQMERSGQIDMDAFRGERNDDDEAEMLGDGGMEPGDLDEHGHPRRGADEQYTPVE